MNDWCICWFLSIYLLGILIFKGFTARRLYKSFSIKGLMSSVYGADIDRMMMDRILYVVDKRDMYQ